MKASKVAEIFSAMNPDDEVWFSYLSKEDVELNWEDSGLEDDDGNPIEVGKYLTNENFTTIARSIDDDEGLWQRFNETFSDLCNEVLTDLVVESKSAVDDESLWDTEGEPNESK